MDLKVLAVETAEDLRDVEFYNVEKIGIMAGASTPSFIIEDIKKTLEKI